jgi:hypothetical protein
MQAAIAECGVPVSSLTDNGLVYSGYRRGRIVDFEKNLQAMGVATICSSPHHPQTCGKIERFWQTLKKWLDAHDTPGTLAQMQALLDQFREHYNHHRPHRALSGHTPAEAFAATGKATPATGTQPAHSVRVLDRKVSTDGLVGIDRTRISVGKQWAGHHLSVICDSNQAVLISGTRLVREVTLNGQDYIPAEHARYDLRGYRQPHPTTS